MKALLNILFVCVYSLSFSQRPDLSVGVSGSIKSLTGSTQSFLATGADIHFHLSKRSMLAGSQIGFWTTFSKEGDQNFNHLNLDISAGIIIIRKPAFKLIFQLPFSNNFSLNSKMVLDNQTDFDPYSLFISPELSVRYKFLLFGINYVAPAVGSNVRGPGLRIGCNI
jgi:hypothetical protein